MKTQEAVEKLLKIKSDADRYHLDISDLQECIKELVDVCIEITEQIEPEQ